MDCYVKKSINYNKVSLRLVRTIPCLCMLFTMVSQAVGANIAMSVSTSDEHPGLQQALFLVKLLRSEYARVLREKNGLLSTNVMKKREFVTSATTNRKYDETEGNRRYILKRGGRRFEYDDMFRPQPDSINSSKSKTEILSTVTFSSPMSESVTQNDTTMSISSKLVHHQESNSFKHSQSTEHNTSSLPIRAESASSISTKVTSILMKTTQDSKTLKVQIISEKSSPPCQIPPVINPEISQAAVELEKELSFGFQNKNSASQMSTAWPTSIRIHLAGSTRYPLPLPENHAFCYTNPKSALCRTLI